MPEDAILLEGLTVDYGRNRVLEDLDLRVRRQTVHGLLGRNGAGKTTTIRAVAGLLEPVSGRLSVLGRDPGAGSVRRLLSILPADDGLVPGLTVTENLEVWASIWGMNRKDAARAAALALEAVGMEGSPSRPVRTLSTGNRRLAALARTFMIPGEIVILDEPTSSLDPVAASRIREAVSAVSKARTVVLSTHNLEEARNLCSEVTIIHHGRTVFTGTPGSVGREGSYHVRTESGALGWKGATLEAGADGTVLLDSGLPAAETLAELVRQGVRVIEFRPAVKTLTDIFMETAGD